VQLDYQVVWYKSRRGEVFTIADRLTSIERIIGSLGSERICGNQVSSAFRERNGKDILFGCAEDDMLGGGFGNDTKRCNSGNNSDTGGPAANLLQGGSGKDFLYSRASKIHIRVTRSAS
jgi:Ca2+-binding RTX toxin-like protein